MKEEIPNLKYLKEISGGDLIFEKKMIEIVKNELPNEIKSYENFLNEQNFKEAAEIVHKIKHKISILGLEKSYQIAIDYEENLKNKKTNQRELFQNILNKMVNFINQF